jgi:hypothetical protein
MAFTGKSEKVIKTEKVNVVCGQRIQPENKRDRFPLSKPAR